MTKSEAVETIAADLDDANADAARIVDHAYNLRDNGSKAERTAAAVVITMYSSEINDILADLAPAAKPAAHRHQFSNGVCSCGKRSSMMTKAEWNAHYGN